MGLFKKKKPTTFLKTSWNDLNVGDLLTIKEIDKLQLATEDEKNLRVAALLAGISYEEIIQIPLDYVRVYMDNCAFLFTPPQPKKVKRQYIINGRKYRLLKNEMELITSQYIDFQALYMEGFEKRPGELLSIMMVPEGHTYNDGYDKDQVVEDMYCMKVEEALGVVDFFTKRYVRLIEWARMYLKWKLKTMVMTARKEDKEMLKATQIQLNTIMDQLASAYGFLSLKR